MNCGNDNCRVLRNFTLNERTLIKNRVLYWANSLQNVFLASARTSTMVNLIFWSPLLRISTLLLSFTLYFTWKRLPSVVRAVTVTFFTFKLCLITNVESGFNFKVRSNFFGFFFGVLLEVVLLLFLPQELKDEELENLLFTSFRYGILLYNWFKSQRVSKFSAAWLAIVLPEITPSSVVPLSQ